MSASGIGLTGWRRDVSALGLFLLLTVLHTWPLASVPFTETTPSSDTLLNVWALRELARQLLTDPLRLLDGNAFHPYTDNTVALVDHMFANALLVAPLWLVTEHSIFIYNIALLATFALTGFFTYKLVAKLCDSHIAGLFAGVAFAFSSIRWHQLTHLHAASTQWLPLALLALHAFVDRPTRQRLVAFTGAALLLAFSSWHLALFGSFSIAVVALWMTIGDGRPIGRRVWMLLTAALVVFVALIPFALAYVDTAEAWRPRFSPAERVNDLQRYSLSVEALLATGHTARVWYAPALTSFGVGEWRGFPGLITMTLAALALLTFKGAGRPSRLFCAVLIVIGLGMGLLASGVLLAAQGDARLVNRVSPYAPFALLGLALFVMGLWSARLVGRPVPGEPRSASHLRLVTLAYLAVVALGAMLSFGPTVYAWGVNLGSGIYREDWLPLFSILRTPGRFVMLVALGTAVLAGLGVRILASRLPPRIGAGVLAVLFLLLNLDLRIAPIELTATLEADATHRWLARAPDLGSVIEYPLGRSLWWMQLSPAHGRGLVNGSGYVQPHMFDDAKATPDLSRAQLDILWEYFHPRFAVVHAWLYDPDEYAALLAAIEAEPAAIVERARFGNDVIFELMDRGAGSNIYRRWPRRALEQAFDLMFRGGVVTSAADDTLATLEVLLNGRTVLHFEGPAAEQHSQRVALYERDWLVPGVNTFEIRSDYRLSPEASTRAIGETGIGVRADVAVASRPDGSWIQVNGQRLSVDKGYTLAVLDSESGVVRSHDNFNTSWYRDDSDRLARFIADLPEGSPVVVASEFDVSRALTEEAVAALKSLGLGHDLRGRFHVLHAAIGIKGARPGTALETIDSHEASVTVGNPRSLNVELSALELR